YAARHVAERSQPSRVANGRSGVQDRAKIESIVNLWRPGHTRARCNDEQHIRLSAASPRTRLAPRRGLEPPRFAALVHETSASTNSATWAGARGNVAFRPARHR